MALAEYDGRGWQQRRYTPLNSATTTTVTHPPCRPLPPHPPTISLAFPCSDHEKGRTSSPVLRDVEWGCNLDVFHLLLISLFLSLLLFPPILLPLYSFLFLFFFLSYFRHFRISLFPYSLPIPSELDPEIRRRNR